MRLSHNDVFNEVIGDVVSDQSVQIKREEMGNAFFGYLWRTMDIEKKSFCSTNPEQGW